MDLQTTNLNNLGSTFLHTQTVTKGRYQHFLTGTSKDLAGGGGWWERKHNKGIYLHLQSVT